MDTELTTALTTVSEKIQSAPTLFGALCEFNNALAQWQLIYGHWYDGVWWHTCSHMVSKYLKHNNQGDLRGQISSA
jgi:hypothetical protein